MGSQTLWKENILAVREIPELKEDIIKEKLAHNTAVAAHYYCDPDIIDIADCFGDSAELAEAVSKLKQNRVVVCAVHFVAECIKLRCPEKEIILAHSQARCPVSGQLRAERLRYYREDHPQALIVGCTSASIALKANSDICVTPANAIEAIGSFNNEEILFYSDKYLGSYLASQLPGKRIETMNCCCPTMASPDLRDVELARIKWPEAVLAANNRCCPDIVSSADFVGGTGDIIRFCACVEQDVIVADEVNVCRYLNRRYPQRNFYQLAPSKLVCNNMHITDLETVERAVKGDFGHRITIDPEQFDAAAQSLYVSKKSI